MLSWISLETASRIDGALAPSQELGRQHVNGENKVQSLLGPARFEGLEEQGVTQGLKLCPFWDLGLSVSTPVVH